MVTIVSDNFEGDLIFLLLCFGGIVSSSEAQTNIL